MQVVLESHSEIEEMMRKQIMTLQLAKKEHDRKLARQMDETKQLKKNLVHVQDIFKKTKGETLKLNQKLK